MLCSFKELGLPPLPHEHGTADKGHGKPHPDIINFDGITIERVPCATWANVRQNPLLRVSIPVLEDEARACLHDKYKLTGVRYDSFDMCRALWDCIVNAMGMTLSLDTYIYGSVMRDRKYLVLSCEYRKRELLSFTGGNARFGTKANRRLIVEGIAKNAADEEELRPVSEKRLSLVAASPKGKPTSKRAPTKAKFRASRGGKAIATNVARPHGTIYPIDPRDLAASKHAPLIRYITKKGMWGLPVADNSDCDGYAGLDLEDAFGLPRSPSPEADFARLGIRGLKEELKRYKTNLSLKDRKPDYLIIDDPIMFPELVGVKVSQQKATFCHEFGDQSVQRGTGRIRESWSKGETAPKSVTDSWTLAGQKLILDEANDTLLIVYSAAHDQRIDKADRVRPALRHGEHVIAKWILSVLLGELETKYGNGTLLVSDADHDGLYDTGIILRPLRGRDFLNMLKAGELTYDAGATDNGKSRWRSCLRIKSKKVIDQLTEERWHVEDGHVVMF